MKLQIMAYPDLLEISETLDLVLNPINIMKMLRELTKYGYICQYDFPKAKETESIKGLQMGFWIPLPISVPIQDRIWNYKESLQV